MQHFGDKALQCAPVYYMYGAALLCKAQEDSNVLGAPAAEANASREKALQAADAKPAVVNPADPKGKGKAAAAPAAPAGDDDGDDGDDEEGDSDDEGDDEEGGGPVSDTTLAWENLEMARLIYSAHAGHEEQLAQVHVKLGEVMLEEDQFEQALEDFDNAHTLYLRLTPVPLRRIANLLCSASDALVALQRPGEALERFRQSMKGLRSRLDELRATTEEGAAHPEAVDIQETLELMQLREEELLQSATEYNRVKQAMAAMLCGTTIGGAGPSAAGPPAFEAPKQPGAASTNLGVVGRGVNRVNPSPMPAGGAQASGAQAAPRRFVPEPVAWPGSGGAGAGGASAAGPAVPMPLSAKRPADAATATEPAKAAKQEAAGECKQQ